MRRHGWNEIAKINETVPKQLYCSLARVKFRAGNNKTKIERRRQSVDAKRWRTGGNLKEMQMWSNLASLQLTDAACRPPPFSESLTFLTSFL